MTARAPPYQRSLVETTATTHSARPISSRPTAAQGSTAAPSPADAGGTGGTGSRRRYAKRGPRRGGAGSAGAAAARRARRPAAGGADRGRSPFSRPRCGSSRFRPGTRCLTTASAPTPRSWRGASRRWPGSVGRAQGADPRAHHRQRHAAARAAARVHPHARQDHRARPAHRHEPADPAPRLPATSAPAPSWTRRIRGARRHPRSLSARRRSRPSGSTSSATRWRDQGLRSRDAAHAASRAEASR